MRVCNAILINGEGKTVEVSAWRLQADVLASAMRGCLYIFVNCRAKPPRERTNCWFRLNIDAMSSYLVERNESAGQANRQQQVRRSNVEHGRVRHGGDDPAEPVRNVRA
ncbi:hypothetical protein niasHT_002253 [Heterodera trifolii]|uniref:Uncharacterized protein n=1 Tax=Heterodera trifolii TaxID=157864 RepID=A0ABD2MF20_9BILA